MHGLKKGLNLGSQSEEGWWIKGVVWSNIMDFKTIFNVSYHNTLQSIALAWVEKGSNLGSRSEEGWWIKGVVWSSSNYLLAHPPFLETQQQLPQQYSKTCIVHIMQYYGLQNYIQSLLCKGQVYVCPKLVVFHLPPKYCTKAHVRNWPMAISHLT